jgi:hypothetical protein
VWHLFHPLGNAAALKASEAMHALKRVGEADEVAAALEFLLHPSNSFITGACACVRHSKHRRAWVCRAALCDDASVLQRCHCLLGHLLLQCAACCNCILAQICGHG